MHYDRDLHHGIRRGIVVAFFSNAVDTKGLSTRHTRWPSQLVFARGSMVLANPSFFVFALFEPKNKKRE